MARPINEGAGPSQRRSESMPDYDRMRELEIAIANLGYGLLSLDLECSTGEIPRLKVKLIQLPRPDAPSPTPSV